MITKFRAWDNKKNNWLSNYEDCYIGEHGDVFNQKYISDGEYLRIQNATPEYWIGIKDSFNKEIYESDIVKVDDKSIFYIEFVGCGFWFVDPIDKDCLIFDSRVYKLEVIGNMHENKNIIDDIIKKDAEILEEKK